MKGHNQQIYIAYLIIHLHIFSHHSIKKIIFPHVLDTGNCHYVLHIKYHSYLINKNSKLVILKHQLDIIHPMSLHIFVDFLLHKLI